jgi:hypothetical protein
MFPFIPTMCVKGSVFVNDTFSTEIHQIAQNVQRVCRQLVGRGLQSLPDIIKGCELPSTQVKQALLLTVQHNYVSAYTHRDEEGTRGARPPVAVYEANTDVMLQIIR